MRFTLQISRTGPEQEVELLEYRMEARITHENANADFEGKFFLVCISAVT